MISYRTIILSLHIIYCLFYIWIFVEGILDIDLNYLNVTNTPYPNCADTVAHNFLILGNLSIVLGIAGCFSICFNPRSHSPNLMTFSIITTGSLLYTMLLYFLTISTCKYCFDYINVSDQQMYKFFATPSSLEHRFIGYMCAFAVGVLAAPQAILCCVAELGKLCDKLYTYSLKKYMGLYGNIDNNNSAGEALI